MSKTLLALGDLLGERGSLERAALAVLGQVPGLGSVEEAKKRT